MSKVKRVVLDLDDTVVKTNKCLVGKIISNVCHHRETNDKRKEAYRHLLLNRNAVLFELKENLRWLDKGVHDAMEDLIKEHGLVGGKYMLEAELDTALINFLTHSIVPYQETTGIEIDICTHRGMCENGVEYTHQYLKDHNIDHLFKNVFVLNPEEAPDKRDFLRDTYGDGNFVLLDDNPTHNPHPIPRCDNLIVCDTVYASNRFKHQRKFNSAHLPVLYGHLKQLGYYNHVVVAYDKFI